MKIVLNRFDRANILIRKISTRSGYKLWLVIDLAWYDLWLWSWLWLLLLVEVMVVVNNSCGYGCWLLMVVVINGCGYGCGY